MIRRKIILFITLQLMISNAFAWRPNGEVYKGKNETENANFSDQFPFGDQARVTSLRSLVIIYFSSPSPSEGAEIAVSFSSEQPSQVRSADATPMRQVPALGLGGAGISEGCSGGSLDSIPSGINLDFFPKDSGCPDQSDQGGQSEYHLTGRQNYRGVDFTFKAVVSSQRLQVTITSGDIKYSFTMNNT
ncbi:hypothetical protein EOPP23_15520 [Endozoicomonas sp. OPT23]|uniref:hypothetical protein n=1 Tax=Endozoicomonas sp. OPT23 TaxID=2072845 RepID=UPI00129BF114|nr:hypothetical protein [Endozoicomonas sp. OPT23]MRI34398.1 hypothetical protein [Endozoicomonas sp. OPT23]